MVDRKPLVSVILCVRNGMPYVKETLQSIFSLSYPNYEIIVQDGASTDGTLEYLHSLPKAANLSIVSEADSGIGQGFNRALKRCKGELIGSVDADNRLCADALESVIEAFDKQPEAAAIYGEHDHIDIDGQQIGSWRPPAFDLLAFLDGSLVPPFASSFFSRRICGERLFFDETFPTVADFDLWLRIAHLPIVRIEKTICEVRVGKMSSTWNPQSYEKHLKYKVLALRRYLDGEGRSHAVEALFERARAGLHLWAVDSMGVIGGPQELIDKYFEGVAEVDVRSDRFRNIVKRTNPKLPPSAQELSMKLFECGVNYLDGGQPDQALVYFSLLHSSGFQIPNLEELLSLSEKHARETEIALRDKLLNNLQVTANELQAALDEVSTREKTPLRLSRLLKSRDT
jgi:glycosyltransferase involved in cell wall biosynthesis